MKIEDQFRSSFQLAAIGIARVALDGKYISVNQRFCQICGFTPDELLRRTFQDISHPDDISVDLAHMTEILAGNKTNCSVEK